MQTLNENIRAWLIASQISTVKLSDWLSLLKAHSLSMAEIMSRSDTQWLEMGLPHKVVALRQSKALQINKAITYLQHNDVECIPYNSTHYPNNLKQLSHPPLVLFIKGSAEKLSRLQIAIVGSRHATRNGASITQQIAAELADSDCIITSGLARGIDAAAHLGACHSGNTIAVLGTGIDICYPKYNEKLRDQIIDNGGVLVSEFLPGTPPRPHHFPCRNRIVAALSSGVLVAEAKIKSGSLITANLAADMGKDVFAIPGNINQPLSEGVNWLIQQGAKLVTCSHDIIEELGFFLQPSGNPKKTQQKRLASCPILDSVDYDVCSIDDITTRSKLPVSEVVVVLLEYELRGIVAAVPGGYIKLRGK